MFPTIWEYGLHFNTKDTDDGCVTLDCGVEFKFDQSSCTSHHDRNIIKGKLGYTKKLQEIMQVDFTYIQFVIFRCKWWNTFDWSKVKEYHESGLICMNSIRMWRETKEPYVFPKNWNQVSFYSDVLDRDSWFVLRHDPRSKHLFENNNVIMPSVEDNHGDGNGEWYVLVSFWNFLLWMCHFIIVIYNLPILICICFMMLDMKIE